jgi:uncharacterized membrane protein
MTKGMLLAGGMGFGAALMYLLDPGRGRRRRAQLRDQLTSAVNRAACRANVAARDLSHRARGLAAEARSTFIGAEQPDDRVLVERVRSAIGRAVSHPHALHVEAADGRVTLSGPVLAREVPHLLACVAAVPGVRGVEDALDVHEEAGRFSALQGAGRDRTGAPVKWSLASRLLAGAGGGALMANCLARRTPGAIFLGTLGFGLFVRGLTNLELTRSTGVTGPGRGHRPHEVRKTVTIHAPVEEVFEFWTFCENFPRFMAHLRDVRDLGNGRSHWVAVGPTGIEVSWTAILTRVELNQLIAWRSEPGSEVANAGVVRFERLGERETRLDIHIFYSPPGGALGRFVASLFGADAKSALDEDLVRFKSLLEKGKASAPGKHATRDDLVVTASA